MAADPTPVVFVVDDDISVRESLDLLIRTAGWQAETYASAQAFLARTGVPGPSCLVLDVSLPDLTGLDLQERIGPNRSDLPIIFITGHGDIPMSVRAMKAGAVEFLTKPFREQDLLDAIALALDRSRIAKERRTELSRIRRRCDSLTVRERAVMTRVVQGMLNKQVAAE